MSDRPEDDDTDDIDIAFIGGDDEPDEPTDASEGGHDQAETAQDDRSDYTVGYGRPPREHQFKKGQPGNPHRGPNRKQRETPQDIYARALGRRVKRREGGEQREVTALEQLVDQTMVDAMRGDRFARRDALRLARAVIVVGDPAANDTDERDEEIARLKAKINDLRIRLQTFGDMAEDILDIVQQGYQIETLCDCLAEYYDLIKELALFATPIPATENHHRGEE